MRTLSLFRTILTLILTILPMIDLGYMINANNSVTDVDVVVVRDVHIVAAVVKVSKLKKLFSSSLTTRRNRLERFALVFTAWFSIL